MRLKGPSGGGASTTRVQWHQGPLPALTMGVHVVRISTCPFNQQQGNGFLECC